uniref:Uncharacterized protein n=1 Tax=Arundo donax TaxID=35708 RepID=A0A0A8ZRG4_ARUDO
MLPLLVNSSLSVGHGVDKSSSCEAIALRRSNSATITEIIPRGVWSRSKNGQRGVKGWNIWSRSKNRRRGVRRWNMSGAMSVVVSELTRRNIQRSGNNRR